MRRFARVYEVPGREPREFVVTRRSHTVAVLKQPAAVLASRPRRDPRVLTSSRETSGESPVSSIRHFNSRSRIRFDGPSSAQGTTYFFAMSEVRGIDHWGVYEEDLVAVDGVWHFKRRAVVIEGGRAERLDRVRRCSRVVRQELTAALDGGRMEPFAPGSRSTTSVPSWTSMRFAVRTAWR